MGESRAEQVARIVMSVLFVATFLTIFFFTVVAKVEGQVVDDQIKYLIGDFGDSLRLLPPQIRQKLIDQVTSFKKPDLSDEDAKVAENNKKIIKKAVILIVVSFVIIMLGIYFASRHFGFSMFDVIRDNMIILAFVALTEVVFLFVFAKHYISVDPNYVKKTFVDKISTL